MATFHIFPEEKRKYSKNSFSKFSAYQQDIASGNIMGKDRSLKCGNFPYTIFCSPYAFHFQGSENANITLSE
jgi:hypothetical protein